MEQTESKTLSSLNLATTATNKDIAIGSYRYSTLKLHLRYN